MVRGIFITLEGGEGSGKTTQKDLLRKYLENLGKNVVVTREPGGTLLAEYIRDLLQHNKIPEKIAIETEIMLFAASRTQHVQSVILPALNRGDYVVSDRFLDSSLAYQGYGRGFDVTEIMRANSLAVRNCMPDITFLLDQDPFIGAGRVNRRYIGSGDQLDRFESEPRSFHEKVRQGYLDLAKLYSQRIQVVDATKSVDEIHEDIVKKFILKFPKLKV